MSWAQIREDANRERSEQNRQVKQERKTSRNQVLVQKALKVKYVETPRGTVEEKPRTLEEKRIIKAEKNRRNRQHKRLQKCAELAELDKAKKEAVAKSETEVVDKSIYICVGNVKKTPLEILQAEHNALEIRRLDRLTRRILELTPDTFHAKKEMKIKLEDFVKREQDLIKQLKFCSFPTLVKDNAMKLSAEFQSYVIKLFDNYAFVWIGPIHQLFWELSMSPSPPELERMLARQIREENEVGRSAVGGSVPLQSPFATRPYATRPFESKTETNTKSNVGIGRLCNGKCNEVPPFETCAACERRDYDKRLSRRGTWQCDGGCFQDPSGFKLCLACADKIEKGLACDGHCGGSCKICVEKGKALEADLQKRKDNYQKKLLASVAASITTASAATETKVETKIAPFVDKLKQDVKSGLVGGEPSYEMRLPLTRDWMNYIEVHPESIIKKATRHHIEIGRICVPNTCLTRVLAKAIDKSCSGSDWKSEYRRRFYMECTIPIADPKDVQMFAKRELHTSMLAYNVKTLTDEELFLFALSLPQVYADWNFPEASHFHGNQLLLAAGDLVTEVALRNNTYAMMQNRSSLVPVDFDFGDKKSKMELRDSFVKHMIGYTQGLIGRRLVNTHRLTVRGWVVEFRSAFDEAFDGTEKSLYAVGRHVMKYFQPILESIYIHSDYCKGTVISCLLDNEARCVLHPNEGRDGVCLGMAKHNCSPDTCGVKLRPYPGPLSS